MAASPTAAASAAQPQTSTDSFVLSDMSVQSLARMWRMLDEDTDGLLQPDQLRTMIAAVGIPPTQQLVAGITQCAPEKWRDKGVDIDTFLSCCEVYLTKEPLSMDAIEEVFEYFEEDDVQHVAGKHLRHVLQGAFTSHNTQLLPSEVDEVFRVLGIDDDEPVQYTRLAKQLAGGHQPIEEAEASRKVSMSARLAAIRAYMGRERQSSVAATRLAAAREEYRRASVDQAKQQKRAQRAAAGTGPGGARRLAGSPVMSSSSDSDDGVF